MAGTAQIQADCFQFWKSLYQGSEAIRVDVEKHICTKGFVKCESNFTWKGKRKGARTIYAKKMQQSAPEFAIFDAGILVHPSLLYLGASPDGKVFDPSTENKYGLQDIKCPFSKRGDTLE